MPYPPLGLRALVYAASFFICSQLHSAANPQAVPGVIRIMRLVGTATITEDSTGKTVDLRPGDVLAEHYTIQTGPYSSVVLLFSNGSTLLIKADTELSISEFIQDPFQASTEYMSQLEAEPSSSQTTLKLNYGTLVGKIKPLNTEEGSSYDVATPIGIAGIRGTSFALSVSKDQGTLQVAEGEMFFLPSLGDYDGQYIIAKSETQLAISSKEIKTTPLSSDLRDNILQESLEAAEWLDTVKSIQLQPGAENTPAIQALEATPPSATASPEDPPSLPAKLEPLPPPTSLPKEKEIPPYDLPNLDSDTIEDSILVPFATPPPASPIGGA